MSNNTAQTTKPSPLSELLGGLLGAVLVGTIEDQTKK